MKSAFKDNGAVVLQEAAKLLRDLGTTLLDDPDEFRKMADMPRLLRDATAGALHQQAEFLDVVREEVIRNGSDA